MWLDSVQGITDSWMGCMHRNGYQIMGNGRWFSMALKKPKKKNVQKKKAAAPTKAALPDTQVDDDDAVDADLSDEDDKPWIKKKPALPSEPSTPSLHPTAESDDVDPDDGPSSAPPFPDRRDVGPTVHLHPRRR